MIRGSKSLALSALLVAIVAPLCIDWIEAQKTIANSYQPQQQYSGSGPNAVYGGYQVASAGRPRPQPSAYAPASPPRRPQQVGAYKNPAGSQSYQSVQRPAYQPQTQPQPQPQPSYDSGDQAEADAEPASYGSVQGAPGSDFPSYTQVPKTSFTCKDKPYEYGMYADEETQCQAYHLCYNGRKDSFLCGPGTVFNQRILHCDYWYSTECDKSSQYWSSNAYMGSSQPEPGPAQASGSAPEGSAYRPNQVASASGNRPASYQRPQASSGYGPQQQQVEEAY